jgi:ribosomal protein L28
MAKICDRCGRGALTANRRSHSNIATKRRQLVNLQTRRLGGQTLKLCTRCIRTATSRADATLQRSNQVVMEK